jgi:hypothetical protein
MSMNTPNLTGEKPLIRTVALAWTAFISIGSSAFAGGHGGFVVEVSRVEPDGVGGMQ